MAAALPTLATVFGLSKDGQLPDIGKIVQAFDFSKIDVKTSQSDDYLHCDLAPSFGKLSAAGLQDMDDELKIMIAGTTKLIGDIPKEKRNWDSVMASCMQNFLMEPDGDAIARADKLIKKSSENFQTDGSPKDQIVQEVSTWFSNLVSDMDVLAATKIDINVLGRIVASSGATIDSFESFFAKHEHHEQTMLDIGILRYPDIDHPYFKVYRIKLTAWSDSQRILFHQEDDNGITGEFNSRRFKPRESVIKGMSDKARGAAINAANNLFG